MELEAILSANLRKYQYMSSVNRFATSRRTDYKHICPPHFEDNAGMAHDDIQYPGNSAFHPVARKGQQQANEREHLPIFHSRIHRLCLDSRSTSGRALSGRNQDFRSEDCSVSRLVSVE